MADTAQEIVIATEAAPPPALVTSPMELLSRALERGADLAMVEKLMDLAERQERNLAKKAFDAAVAQAKAEIKPVVKNRKGHNGRYADQGAFAAAVDPVLAKYGLSARYRSHQDDRISVTCVLSHRDGYSEETTLSGPPDTSGQKNALQAMGSTLTYLERYTLKLSLGLAASEDDDGQAAGGDPPITEEELIALRARIDETNADTPRLCEALKVDALPDLTQAGLKAANKLLDERAKKLAAKKTAGAK